VAKKEDKGAAPGPDLTPPDEPELEPRDNKRRHVVAPTPVEKLEAELVKAFDKAKEFGMDPGRGLERIAACSLTLGNWGRSRDPGLFIRLKEARAARDHLAMLDAAHEIAEGAKAKAGASAKVWEVIAPLLKKVFLGALA